MEKLATFEAAEKQAKVEAAEKRVLILLARMCTRSFGNPTPP